jgi:acetyl esterase/lipase
MNRAILTSLAILVACSTVRAAEPPSSVQFTRDVVYGKGGGEELKLNIARPKADQKNLPCVVFIHGGGWAMGDRTAHDGMTWGFAQKGYVAATVEYRLAPKAQFPAAVNDVKCAIRFLRAKADDYGIDPRHIGVCGFSAGGHLALMLGVTQKTDSLEGDGGWDDQPSDVQAVVSYFGPTDLTADDIPRSVYPLMEKFIGGPMAGKRVEYQRASPVTYVTPGDAPTLMFQGTKDPLVPFTQAYRMLQAMTKAGVEGRAEVIAGAGHGWMGKDLTRTLVETAAFFDEHLKPAPATQAARAPTPKR